MASRSALIALLVAVSCAAAASAADLTVGGPQGWTQGADYDSWARSQSFAVGDVLVFNWVGTHDVVEVTKSGYDSCSIGNALNTSTTTPTRITLTAGDHYYICGIPNHCSGGGMKLAVNVGGGPGSPSTPPTPGTPEAPGTPGTPSAPGTPSTPTPAGPRPGSGAPARLTAGPALAAVAAGVLLKLALF